MAERATKQIIANWNDDTDFTWTYTTNINHECFNIYDDDEKYCKGIVFDIKSLSEDYVPQDKIEEAKALLIKECYFVMKITDEMEERIDKCAYEDEGDCLGC